MALILLLESTDPDLRTQAGRRVTVDARLTVGRGADNDLVLADPNRVLSKNHLVIEADGDGYVVVDTSTNGVFLNEQTERLPRDVPAPLGVGDQLRLGSYEISVVSIGAAPPPPPTRGAPVAAEPDALDPFADPLEPPPPSNPGFGSPGSGSQGFGGSGFATSGFGGPNDTFGSSAPSHGAPLIPEDDDFFGSPPGAAAAAASSQLPGMRPATPLIPDDDDLFGPPSAQDDWKGHSAPDHTPADQAFFAPPKASVEKIPDDWDLGPDLGVTPMPATPMSATATPAQPPRPAPVQPASRPSAPAGPVLARAPDNGAVAQFLAGAGLPATSLADQEAAAMMAMVGETMRIVVKGLTEVLAARSTTKQEFRIERTVIGAMGNNPLKFADNLDDVMRVMLLRRTPGFLSAAEAVEEALNDVKAHQLAMLAGMQVALTTVIARFDPAKLEARLEQRSLLDGILPGARKARYWETFKSLYAEIARELEDDFKSLFGDEFARAYKAQIDQLGSPRG